MAIIKGAKNIADILGIKPETVSRWRKAYEDFPVKKNSNRDLIVDHEQLREWGLRNGKIKPASISDFETSSSTAEVKAPPVVEENVNFDDFVDLEKIGDYPEPTGDIEDELKEARKLRHLFSRLVFNWKLETLSDPKSAKSFRDFAAELARQIAVIGRLEESLVKQRMRTGKLLDEQTLMDFATRLADALIDRDERMKERCFKIVSDEVAAICHEKGVDLSLNSDKVFKNWGKVFDDGRHEYAEAAVKVAEDVSADQSDRLGGSDED